MSDERPLHALEGAPGSGSLCGVPHGQVLTWAVTPERVTCKDCRAILDTPKAGQVRVYRAGELSWEDPPGPNAAEPTMDDRLKALGEASKVLTTRNLHDLLTVAEYVVAGPEAANRFSRDWQVDES